MSHAVAGLRLLALVAGAGCVSSLAAGQEAALGGEPVQAAGEALRVEGAFTLVDTIPEAVAAGRANVRPLAYQAVRVDLAGLRAMLAGAPVAESPASAGEDGPLVMALPMPDGTFARFLVVESSIMEPALQAAFPEMRTYLGQGLDQPAATVRFDVTPQGFHAQVLSPDGAVYIDPYTGGNTEYVTSHYKRDLRRGVGRWTCGTVDEGQPAATPGPAGYAPRGVSRKTFRLAVTCSGEFAAFHSDLNGNPANVTDTMAAIVTLVNRVTGIYEIDLGARLVLVGTNQQLIFLNPGTDPFQNNGSATDRDMAHTVISNTIGNASFDVGHVFETSDGGIAFIGALCAATHKGKGLSGLPAPINDAFSVDYVAHEMGHQFNGRHNFNSCGGAPGDSFAIAYEPGSGTSIMCYAGICGPDNVQDHSDPMFGAHSVEVMRSYIAASTCGQGAVTTNTVPQVTPGPSYKIPFGTPYALTPGTWSDPDGDVLTFSWEQRDTASVAVPLPLVDNGANPLAEVMPPSLSATRTIPNNASLRSNILLPTEILPGAGRTLHYRVVVRDNRAGEGGVAWADKNVTVVPTIGPFRVTKPNVAGTWNRAQPDVTWDVNGTNAGLVSCANVRILLSTDGGITFPTVLVESTPNDGTESVSMPDIQTTQARVKVEGVGNIFFDISNANFTINPRPAGVAYSATGNNVLDDSEINGNANATPDPGENNISIFIPVRNDGRTTGTNVRGTLSVTTPATGVTVPVNFSNYPDLPTDSVGTNLVPFKLALSPSVTCGVNIGLRLVLQSTQGNLTYNYTIQTGRLFYPVETIVPYPGPELVIPDFPGPPAVAVIPVAGLTDTLSAVKVKFPGTECSSEPVDTVGIQHTYVSDLKVTVIPPASMTGAQPIVVMDRPGTDNPGNNFCDTLLEDAASNSIQDILAGENPFSGSYAPANALAPFANRPASQANGDWTITVEDLAGQDGGVLYRVSLQFYTRQNGRTCDPPRVCEPDFNQDGNVDQADVDYLLNVIGGGENPSGIDPDFNRDGNADQTDVAVFIGVVAGEPCP